MQGALLLQAWLRLPSSPVVQSILRTPIERLLVFTSDPIGSHVIDVFLDEDNAAVTNKDRRTFLLNLIGHYPKLADDRIGSRVADRCWQAADPFLRDKIAHSLLKDELNLQNSHYGHFFLRKVNLPLFRRDPREWRDRQARDVGGTPAELYARAAEKQQMLQLHSQEQQQQKQQQAQDYVSLSNSTLDGARATKEKKKRKKIKTQGTDEIDQLFETVKRGKVQ